MPLSTNSTTNGCAEGRDPDLFIVNAAPSNAGKIVRFSLRGGIGSRPSFDPRRQPIPPLPRIEPERGGAPRWIHVKGGSQFYLRVSQIGSDTRAYTLTLSSKPLAEPTEPNNDMEKATLLKEGGSVKAFMSHAANDPSSISDWYRIDVHRDGKLSLDVDMSQGVVPHVEIINANRRPVHKQDGARGERIQVVTRVPRGTYYVRVYTYSGLDSVGEGDLPPRLEIPYTLTSLRE